MTAIFIIHCWCLSESIITKNTNQHPAAAFVQSNVPPDTSGFSSSSSFTSCSPCTSDNLQFLYLLPPLCPNSSSSSLNFSSCWFCRSGNEEKLMALLTPLNVNCHASDGRKVSCDGSAHLYFVHQGAAASGWRSILANQIIKWFGSKCVSNTSVIAQNLLYFFALTVILIGLKIN